MDKTRIKLLLSSYRPKVDDANDPVFREALELMARDAELESWFRAEQECDAAMVEKFRQVPVNSEAKESIQQALKRAATGDAEVPRK